MGRSNPNTVYLQSAECLLILSTLIEKKLIQFLFLVLDSQTLVEGLQTPMSCKKARDLIEAHRLRESKNFHNFLLVAGMALSKEDVQECMSLYKRYT